jgi:ATP-dependent DNA helicase RecQ
VEPSDDIIGSCARERFGIEYLFPYQRYVIAGLIESLQSEPTRDDADQQGRQIVVLPTGAGKSLCFQLPAAICGGVTIIVYPLLGLMNDQERRMVAAGFSVRQLRGGQDGATRRRIFSELAAGKISFVITNPETLAGASVRQALAGIVPVHAVIDEAHCISEWGDSFRPAYTTLGESLDAIGVVRRTAFTATASDHVITRIREVLFAGAEARVVRGNPDRQNISYAVVPCLSLRHALRRIVSPSPDRKLPAGEADRPATRPERLPVWRPETELPLPAIVFCRTRRETEEVARLLAPHLPPGGAMFYHAGLDRERRTAVEEEFFRRDDAILAATCAYGMGVDKGNIRAVVHTYLPATPEAFLQESGRGGRDRQPALSVVLLSPQEQIAYTAARAAGTVSAVQAMAFGTECRRAVLLRHFGVSGGACGGCDRCDPVERVPVPATVSEADALAGAHRPDGSGEPGGAGHSATDRAHIGGSPATHLLGEVIASDPVRRTTAEWARILTGRFTYADRRRGLSRRAEAGTFSRWTQAEVEGALEEMMALGILMIRRKKVTPCRPEGEHADNRDLPLPFPTR